MNENPMSSSKQETQMSTSEMNERQTTGSETNKDPKQMSTTDLLGRQESGATGSKDGASEEPLVEDAPRLNERWSSLQTKFVDEPQNAVREADGLVAEVIQKL